MKLEVAMLVGAESKQFLVDLTKLVDRMEALTKGAPAKAAKPAAAVEDEDDAAAVEADEDEDFAPKKSKGKKAAAAAFDDEEEEAGEAEAEEEEEDFTTPAPKAKAKAKKLTVDDVNDACKARAARTGGKEGRAEVLALLKKHFKTSSVSDVKAEDYEKLIKIMKA